MSKHQDMLRELLQTESGLTAWEIDFLDSLVSQGLDDSRDDFTNKQADKVEQIWNHIFK